ncbi:MAG: zinc dependent phospholipase C family protein [Ruminiclostridium sp.]|nr:zinc dependent phospholipase C family protein [Ruminiclostridium sp.]
MADGNTHIYFGIGVLAALPEDLSQKLARDMDAFYLGLQGPDPLIFDPRTQKEARGFHKRWDAALPGLVNAMLYGEESMCSFAAGGFLHYVLDDIVHPPIWAWMKEGANHMRMELALDFMILAEEGIKKMPRLFTQGRKRVAPYAYLILPTATPNQYLTGLRAMQVTIDYLRQRGPEALGRLTLVEKENVRTLRRLVDEGIQPTADRLVELIG